jgi:hypothetical protein
MRTYLIRALLISAAEITLHEYLCYVNGTGNWYCAFSEFNVTAEYISCVTRKTAFKGLEASQLIFGSEFC